MKNLLLLSLLFISCSRSLDEGQPTIQGVDSIRLVDRTVLTYRINAPGNVRAAYFERPPYLEPITITPNGSHTRNEVGFPGRWVLITVQGDTLRTFWGEY